MAIVVIIGCVVLWLLINAHMLDNGVEIRSRGSLRYQRRKARRQGVEPWEVDVKARSGVLLPPERRGGHVRGLLEGIGFVVFMFVWVIICMAYRLAPDWIWAGWAILLGLAWWRGRVLKEARADRAAVILPPLGHKRPSEADEPNEVSLAIVKSPAIETSPAIERPRSLARPRVQKRSDWPEVIPPGWTPPE